MDITALSPLPYGVIRKNKDVVDAFTKTEEGITRMQLTAKAVAFIKLGWPDATDEDLDVYSPGTIEAAAFALYKATFSRPEDVAPVPQNP
jgi:hypothetical protein